MPPCNSVNVEERTKNNSELETLPLPFFTGKSTQVFFTLEITDCSQFPLNFWPVVYRSNLCEFLKNAIYGNLCLLILNKIKNTLFIYFKINNIFILLYCFICSLLDKEFKWSSKILNAKLDIHFFLLAMNICPVEK